MAADPNDLIALNQALAADPEYQQLLGLKEHSSTKVPKLIARARALAGGSLPKGAEVNGNTGQVVPDHFLRNSLLYGAAALGGGALAGAAMGGGAAAAGGASTAATGAAGGGTAAGGSALSTGLGLAGAGGKIANGILAGRSAGRQADAAYQAEQDDMNLRRVNVPTIQAGQVLRGDLLSGYKPYVSHVPGVNESTSTGGPTVGVGDNTRQAGAALSSQALADLLAGRNHTATDVPGPGKLDKVLGILGMAGTGLGAWNELRTPQAGAGTTQPAGSGLVSSPANMSLLRGAAGLTKPSLMPSIAPANPSVSGMFTDPGLPSSTDPVQSALNRRKLAQGARF